MKLREIQAEIERRAAAIGAPAALLPSYGASTGHARPHVEVDGRGFHLVVVERGVEEARRTTRDLDELLFLVFEGVTLAMASDHEHGHQDPDHDPRRVLFARQLELLARLSPGWAQRQAADHERLLRAHPFDDAAIARAKLCRELRQQGHPAEEAWQIACQRLPLPDDG
jgi:hypothetical protein